MTHFLVIIFWRRNHKWRRKHKKVIVFWFETLFLLLPYSSAVWPAVSHQIWFPQPIINMTNILVILHICYIHTWHLVSTLNSSLGAVGCWEATGEQLGVQCLAQGHSGMNSGETRGGTLRSQDDAHSPHELMQHFGQHFSTFFQNKGNLHIWYNNTHITMLSLHNL